MKKVKVLVLTEKQGAYWLTNPNVGELMLPVGDKVFVGEDIPKDLPQGSPSYWRWDEATKSIVSLPAKEQEKFHVEQAVFHPVPTASSGEQVKFIAKELLDEEFAKVRHEMKALHFKALESIEFNAGETERLLKDSDKLVLRALVVCIASVLVGVIAVALIHG